MGNDEYDHTDRRPPRGASGTTKRPPGDGTRLLTYGEAAARLGVDAAILRGWVRRRLVPHIRVAPRVVRFHADALDRFIATRSVEPKA